VRCTGAIGGRGGGAGDRVERQAEQCRAAGKEELVNGGLGGDVELSRVSGKREGQGFKARRAAEGCEYLGREVQSAGCGKRTAQHSTSIRRCT
jgi:hypothetical protein